MRGKRYNYKIRITSNSISVRGRSVRSMRPPGLFARHARNATGNGHVISISLYARSLVTCRITAKFDS